MAEPLDVEISIVNSNNAVLLRRCLASLPAGCEGVRWRATVIDNGSKDGSADLVRHEFPDHEVVANRVFTALAVNHNRVLARLVRDRSARYALVMHEDVEVPPRTLRTLVDFADGNPRVGAVGPLVVGADSRAHSSFRAFPRVARDLRAAFRPRLGPPDAAGAGWLDGPATLFRVEALAEVGLFDERFFVFYEDTDLGLRLHRADWSSALCVDARVFHHRHGTVGQAGRSRAMELQLLRSRFLYARKHHGAAAAFVLSSGYRAALALRAGKARLRPAQQRDSRLFWDMARFDPRRKLEHELAAERG